jgi:salicylate hydroxylase
MTPHQGQGGTQAVEDAEGFELFNAMDVSRDSVSKVLRDFDRVRRPRASQIQNNTRDAQARKDAYTMYKHTMYNWIYPGVQVCLDRLNAGEEMLPIHEMPPQVAH